ncbi:lipoprotein insertase outer membrane protein LolB [Vibrio sp. Isolate24]|uniref:lipoprotein insertase outer membrane protein LolB n=1 Tax=Vibrio sp. Isolate24 TaxID=2908534 RepID=UPI001EFD4971|nr:lipoprotein insertase outer membrane protein LolB [Vibrio sp. Isolate24]MCG9677893.1 lipoprotein insertase outer membrane protein LolB [Vibrio sp. Isolate24]
MTTYFRPLLIFLFSSFILSGCATFNTSTTNVEWQTHQQRLASIAQYQSNGKLGYISPKQRQSLNFQWKYSPDLSQLRLTTFIGQTALNLKITPSGALVETYDDETYTSHDAQSLIYRLTGLTLPIEQLNSWFLGSPAEADSYRLNETHTLASLTKQINDKVWQLDYLNYQDIQYQGSALPLPQKLKLKQGDISINIVISKWNLEQ